MHGKWKYVWIAILVAAVAIIIIIIGKKSKQSSSAPEQIPQSVRLEKPQRLLVTYQLQYNGDVGAIQQATIVSKVSGSLDQVYVNIGDAVKKNHLLAVIDSTELYQQKLSTSAAYQNAGVSYERTRQLFDQNMLSQSDLDTVEAAMKIAKANYELAITQLSYARIVAPFSGYITYRYQDPGALITANETQLFTLMDLDTVKVVINVLEKDTPLIPQLQKAVVIADAFPDTKYEGRVARYSQAVDLTTRTMAVEIDVANQTHVLKPGMFATAYLIAAEHPNAITLPTIAILKDTTGTYVFSVENNIAKRLPVQISIEQNNRAEIISGLTGDEDIVTTGQQYLHDGAKVNARP